MKRHGDPKFWHDHISDDKKIRGVSAIQFIETSNIVVHALPLMNAVHINVFSCKKFDIEVASRFAAEYWHGTASQVRVVPRV